MPSSEVSRASNWTWLARLGHWGNMADDLAERVDDLICSFDSSAEANMDTLSMLVFGWMLFGLFVLCVGRFVYDKFILPRERARLHHQAAAAPGSAAAGSPLHHQKQQQHHQVNSLAAPVSAKDPLHSAAAGLAAISESAVLLGGGASATGVAAAVAHSRTQPGHAGVGAPSTVLPSPAAKGPRLGAGTPLMGPGLSPGGGTGGGGGAGGGGGGGYVPPTPPMRKRLTRKNSGALVSPARSSKALHLPQATGSDPSAVRWTNEMIVWLHSDLQVLDELLQVWVNSLNDSVGSAIAEHGIGVDFVRVLPETHPPALSNIFCECDSKDDVRITCDCEATPALQLKAFRQHGEKVEASHYRVNVNRFRARLNIACITEKLLVDLKCDGWPDIKVSLAPVGTIKKDADETQLQETLTEIVVGAIRGTNLHLNLSGYHHCPRLWREQVNQNPYLMHGHYDTTQNNSNSISRPQSGQAHSSASTIPQYVPGERRLLVKVVRASELGGSQECREPFCVVELDEPPQRHQTSIKKDTKHPIWDEAFLFDVSQNTTEVLLEIYDRFNKSEKFLGLAIVGVEELLANPSQRQIIPLQARPYEEDEVTGTLTVEFLFIEGAEVPQIGSKPYRVKETIKPSVSPARSFNPLNHMSSTHTMNYSNDYLTNGTTVDSPYRTGQTNGNKGTLIVHSQQRKAERQIVKVTLSQEGRWKEIPCEHLDKEMNPMAKTDNGNVPMTNYDSFKERGRTRKKRRDFFGTIRKRWGRSKTRSRSVGSEVDENHLDGHSRSISADRARDTGSVNLGSTIREGHSRRSSISEASAISGASTRTYVNEASTLVLESLENGIRKHYLIPLALAQKSKWKKKGTKLHIYNDHIFIAKHMSGGTVCEVCGRTLARRLGKQGYECRDCQMKCHKHCHVKVDSMCPSSTIQSMELTFLRNPECKRRNSVRIC